MNITLNADNVDVTIEYEPETLCGTALLPPALRIIARYTGVIAVDRRDLAAWTVPASKPQLAERLKKAVLAGKAITDGHVETDRTGKTYIVTTSKVWGRRLHADLTRLGF